MQGQRAAGARKRSAMFWITSDCPPRVSISMWQLAGFGYNCLRTTKHGLPQFNNGGIRVPMDTEWRRAHSICSYWHIERRPMGTQRWLLFSVWTLPGTHQRVFPCGHCPYGGGLTLSPIHVPAGTRASGIEFEHAVFIVRLPRAWGCSHPVQLKISDFTGNFRSIWGFGPRKSENFENEREKAFGGCKQSVYV